MDFELKLLDVDAVNVDVQYQRELRPDRLRRLENAFNHGASKAISVSRRGDGTFWVYDGQHTLALCKLMGFKTIPAVVVSGDAKKEAQWFLLMNGEGVTKANPEQKQKAAFFAGDELALKAKHLLDLYEIEIAKGGTGAHKTRAIDYIKVCLKADEPRLIRAMDMIDELWRDEKEAWSRAIMRGAYEVAGLEFQDKIQAALSKRQITPRRVLDVARGMQEATGEPGSGMGFMKRAILSLAQIVA
jgi:hypothetical protein